MLYMFVYVYIYKQIVNKNSSEAINHILYYLILSYLILYWASSDQGQGQCRHTKVSPFTTIQTVRSYVSTLVQARNLILGMYVYLTDTNIQIYECRHA